MALNRSPVVVRRATKIPEHMHPVISTKDNTSPAKDEGASEEMFFAWGSELLRSSFGIFFILVVFVASCAPKLVSYEDGTTVAAWDLENLSPMACGRPDLGELLSAKVVETLKETGNWTVVERERLLLALEELGLGTTSMANESTRLRLGKLVGARLMVFGAYQVILDKMRLDLRLVEVETGSILKAVQKTTTAFDVCAWLRAAKEATVELF